ncbi:MAG TPA: hypothetical protein VGN42_11550, partial [Pirellulales bacterium]|nr:hypothetical protein [Pirellulales bacterium]
APRDVRVIRSEINDKISEPKPASEAAGAEAPRLRRASSRAPGGEALRPKTFSSPGAEQRDGESHGLFPHVRRRSRPLEDNEAGPEASVRVGASSLCLAARVG